MKAWRSSIGSHMSSRILSALFILVASFVWILPAGGPHAQESNISPVVQSRVRTTLERYMREHDVPGLSFAIGHSGQLLHAAGLGEAREGVSATSETIYPVGTVSQQFTAALILYLQRHGLGPDGGEMSVKDPLTKYFFGITHWRDAKIENLLTHTSGIPAFTDSIFYRERLFSNVSQREILEFTRRRDLKFDPGTAFEYSDSNYFLLANIVEAALEVYFYDHMQTEIFEQLELTSTGFLHLSPLSRRARGSKDGSPVPEVNHHLMLGSRDIVSSAVDLHRWNRAIMHDNYFGDAAREIMFGRYVELPGIGAYYGAGWFVRYTAPWRQYFTIGFFPGYTSINKIYHDPASGTDYDVVILANRQDLPDIETLADTLFILAR